jgi:hypothetical protein
LATFLRGKSNAFNFDQNVLGFILGDFFPNSSGPPAPEPQNNLGQHRKIKFTERKEHSRLAWTYGMNAGTGHFHPKLFPPRQIQAFLNFSARLLMLLPVG